MYAILRTKKLKNRNKITEATEHNLRLRTQHNINDDRSHLNQILYNPLGINLTEASSFQEKLTEHYLNLNIKEKQNNTLAFEYVVTASPEFFLKKSIEEIGKWSGDQVEFMRKEFGDQVKFAILHLDEKTPHIHFFVSTEVKSIKKYKNRYGFCEKETWSLNSEKIDPDFLADLQTRFALENKKWGLKRGVKGSVQKNVPLKHFYEMVDKIMSTSYKEKINNLIDQIELSFGERLKIETVRNKVREHLSPYLNNFARQSKAYKEFSKLDFHKMQEELIDEHKKLKLELETIAAKREVYKESINEYSEVLAKNDVLKKEIEALKQKYEPEIDSVVEKKDKNNINFQKNKNKIT